MDKELDKKENALAILKKKLNNANVINTVNCIGNIIIGTNGTVKMQEEAKGIFNNYTNLIQSYEIAKIDIKSLVCGTANRSV